MQNPDGRAHDTRYNAYAFDMNRDVLVGTQPEVAGRLRLLWKYPPQLFVDEHENSGTSYFFPPDADPIYHETPNRLYQEVEQVYGPANARAFEAHGWRYETWDSGYDFFAQVYGDTVPTTQMGAVGMTYEQGDSTPYPERVRHQYTSALVDACTPARPIARASCASGAPPSSRPRRKDGSAAWSRTSSSTRAIDLQRQVPNRPVCGYFLLGNSRETRLVVSRLQAAHVVVDRLARRTVVRDYRPYGDAPRRTTLPAGTYWVSLAQAQKHWVQAALNEDTYVPFPYFYDVSGWSLPLLAGIRGRLHRYGRSRPGGARPAAAHAHHAKPPGPLPRIAVLDQFKRTFNDYQYTGWLKWRLAQDWRLPYTVLQPEQVNATSLRTFDVLVVGNVDATPVYRRLGDRVGPLWRPGSQRRSVRRLAGGRPARLGARDLPGRHDHAEDRVARGADADPHPARTQRDRVGQRLQPPPGARRRQGGRRLPAAACTSPGSRRRPRRSPARPSRRSTGWPGKRDRLRLRAELPRGRRRLGTPAHAGDPADADRLGALDDAQQDASERAAVGRAEPRSHAGLAPGPRQPGGTARPTWHS